MINIDYSNFTENVYTNFLNNVTSTIASAYISSSTIGNSNTNNNNDATTQQPFENAVASIDTHPCNPNNPFFNCTQAEYLAFSRGPQTLPLPIVLPVSTYTKL